MEPIHAALRQSQRARPLDLLQKFTEAEAAAGAISEPAPGFWRVPETARDGAGFARGLSRDTCRPSGGISSIFFAPSTWGSKWWERAVWGCAITWCCLKGTARRIRCSCRSSRRCRRRTRSTCRIPLSRTGPARGGRATGHQPISDLLLGWTTIGEHHYLVRQLNDHKGSIDLQKLRGGGLKAWRWSPANCWRGDTRGRETPAKSAATAAPARRW